MTIRFKTNIFTHRIFEHIHKQDIQTNPHTGYSLWWGKAADGAGEAFLSPTTGLWTKHRWKSELLSLSLFGFIFFNKLIRTTQTDCLFARMSFDIESASYNCEILHSGLF